MTVVQHPTRVDIPTADASTSSVLKALRLLDAFQSGIPSMGVSELAIEAGIPVSTAFRLLAQLVEGGFMVKDGKQYRPATKLFELGNKVEHARPLGLRDRVAPILGDLYLRTETTVRLGVLEGADVVLVDKIVGLRTLPAPTPIGGRLPAQCTALGKALLAYAPPAVIQSALAANLPRRTARSVIAPGLLRRQLEESRRTGISYSREETVLGHVCIATPLFEEGRAIAAISAAVPARRMDAKRIIDALLAAARQFERCDEVRRIS